MTRTVHQLKYRHISVVENAIALLTGFFKIRQIKASNDNI